MNIKNIHINRKNIKKILSTQFFTQTDTSSNSDINEGKNRLLIEFFKRFFLILLFFITAIYAFYYIYKYYPFNTNLCNNLDIYNYKYENDIQFISNISNNNYYIFTGKFPFDVITYKLRKDILKNSINEKLEYENKINNKTLDLIENLDDHEIKIISFSSDKKKCENKIFQLYKPNYLTLTSNINDYNFIFNKIDYNYITNPYSFPKKKMYIELLNFIKNNEEQNKILYMTAYLKSLNDSSNIDNLNGEESNTTNVNDLPNNKNKIVNNNNNNNDDNENIKEINNKFNLRNDKNLENQIVSNVNKSIKKKIIYLYDSYDENIVNLIIAIYNLQYGHINKDLKTYWNEIKTNFKIIHPKEIYLLEWYCFAINYNLIENTNTFKLDCVDLLK